MIPEYIHKWYCPNDLLQSILELLCPNQRKPRYIILFDGIVELPFLPLIPQDFISQCEVLLFHFLPLPIHLGELLISL